MTPAQFRLLYINANLIAELALQRFVLDDASDTGNMLPRDGESEDFGALDLSALDGLDELIQQHTSTAGARDGVSQADPGSDAGESTSFDGKEPDLDTTLRAAYADQSFTEQSAAALRGKLDSVRVDALLAALPREMPSLAAALTGEEMDRWLDVYRGQHDALDELIVMLRSTRAF